MMEHSKVKDMTKTKYELYVVYDFFVDYSIKTKIKVLVNYLNL
jgi:hypothetical protein